MKKIRQFLTPALVIAAVASMGGTTFASERLEENVYLVDNQYAIEEQLSVGDDGIIEITPSVERISSNGYFDFAVNSSLTSTDFQVSNTTTTIKLNASIIDPYGNGVTSDYSDHKYKITLKKRGSLFAVDSATFTVDSNPNQFVVTGLSKDATYYFEITNVDYLPGGTKIVGSGSVSNYVHK